MNDWEGPNGESAEPIRSEGDHFRAAITAIARQVEAAQREMLAHINAQVAAAFGTVEEVTAEFSRRLSASMAEVQRSVAEMEPDARRLGEHGWTMPLWGSLPRARAISKVPAEELDALFEREYSDRVRESELLENVCGHEALSRWRPLLEESVVCYRAGHYLVVVPALLAVWEGAIADVSERFSTGDKPGRITRSRVKRLDPGIERLAWVSLDGFASAVFGSHTFAAEPPSLLNRHWVLHGRATPQWGRLDCLRLFQALETLAIVA